MKGFTLVELLVVIGIIVILMTAALVAINPFKQFAMANNASRWSGVTTMMNATTQRMVDKKGKLDFDSDPLTEPDTDCPGVGDDVPAALTIIGKDEYDLCAILVPEYIGGLPRDPQQNTSPVTDCSSDYDTRYEISCTNGRITIKAPDAQLSETITITR